MRVNRQRCAAALTKRLRATLRRLAKAILALEFNHSLKQDMLLIPYTSQKDFSCNIARKLMD